MNRQTVHSNNAYFDVVIALALEGNVIGAYISRSCISTLRFADDICITAESNDELHQLDDNVYLAGIKFGLRVNCSKTEVQCIGRERHQMKVVQSVVLP